MTRLFERTVWSGWQLPPGACCRTKRVYLSGGLLRQVLGEMSAAMTSVVVSEQLRLLRRADQDGASVSSTVRWIVHCHDHATRESARMLFGVFERLSATLSCAFSFQGGLRIAVVGGAGVCEKLRLRADQRVVGRLAC